METGVELIAKERQRQVESEGWTPDHDDQHQKDEIAMAASLYAMPVSKRHVEILAYVWPWEREYWKPSPNDRVKELTKAGALIAAEIDRIQRLSEKSQPNE